MNTEFIALFSDKLNNVKGNVYGCVDDPLLFLQLSLSLLFQLIISPSITKYYSRKFPDLTFFD